MAIEDFSRRDLTFEQAEGAAVLPSQLAKGQITKVLRARLWKALYDSLYATSKFEGGSRKLHSVWQKALADFYVRKYGFFSDKIGVSLDWNLKQLRPIFEEGDYLKVLGAAEWLARQAQSTSFPADVARVLIEERSAYRLIDGQDVVLLASKEEGAALLNALEVLAKKNLNGARAHLKAASSALAQGSFADSVRESVHSMESASRTVSSSSKFSDALAQIEKEGRLHPAFKRGLLALYGYSSDEQGIRHPLLENGDAAVSEADALLMIGICSSAVTYLLSNGRSESSDLI